MFFSRENSSINPLIYMGPGVSQLLLPAADHSYADPLGPSRDWAACAPEGQEKLEKDCALTLALSLTRTGVQRVSSAILPRCIWSDRAI